MSATARLITVVISVMSTSTDAELASNIRAVIDSSPGLNVDSCIVAPDAPELTAADIPSRMIPMLASRGITTLRELCARTEESLIGPGLSWRYIYQLNQRLQALSPPLQLADRPVFAESIDALNLNPGVYLRLRKAGFARITELAQFDAIQAARRWNKLRIPAADINRHLSVVGQRYAPVAPGVYQLDDLGVLYGYNLAPLLYALDELLGYHKDQPIEVLHPSHLATEPDDKLAELKKGRWGDALGQFQYLLGFDQ